MSHHEGEEILFILTGKIELHIGKRKEILNPGDCVQFEFDNTPQADGNDVRAGFSAGCDRPRATSFLLRVASSCTTSKQ
nr:cupin domain-containing protein [Bradyrhizobium sp. Oc8]